MITLIKQDGQTLVELIDMTGTSQTSYQAPVPIREIKVRVAGEFSRGETVRKPVTPKIHRDGNYTEFVVVELSDYEMVVLK
jgi:hypothetical protein